MAFAGPAHAVECGCVRPLRLALLFLAAAVATPALGDSATGSFTISLRVLPRVRTGLPGGQRPAFVSAGGSTLLPCGAEGSATCTTAAATLRAPSGSRTAVTVTVLPDGAPTAIVER